jgi:hypothetical protein
MNYMNKKIFWESLKDININILIIENFYIIYSLNENILIFRNSNYFFLLLNIFNLLIIKYTIKIFIIFRKKYKNFIYNI